MRKNKKEIQEKASVLRKSDTIMMRNGKLDLKALRQDYLEENTETSVANTARILDYFQFERTLSNGAHVAISGDEVDGFSKTIREKSSDFETYYTYYPSGNLKLIGQAYINDFSFGVRYWFTESGEIEKYKDYDAPYHFAWEDVQEFLKKHKVQKKDIYQIGRSDSEDIPKWYISFKTKELENTDNVQHFILNGVTGAVLKKELMDVSRHLD